MNPTGEVKQRPASAAADTVLPAVLAVVCGILLSFTAFFAIRESEAQRAVAEFDRRVDQHVALLREKIDTYEEMFLALRNFQIYAEPVNHDEFHGMAGDYLVRHPEIRALQWAPYVPTSQRAAVEAEVRTDGFPNFEIMEPAAGGGMIRATARPDYLPLIYVEPMKGNETAFGFDLASDASRRTMLDRARDAGEIIATGRIKLAELSADGDIMLVVMPVYHHDPAPATVELRRQLLAGFVIGVLHVHPMMESTLSHARPAGVDLLLLDLSAPVADRVLHYHPAHEGKTLAVSEEAVIRNGLHREIPVHVGGRNWSFMFRPAPEWLATQRTWNPYGALISGLSFTLLLGAYLLGAARRAETVASLVTQRTAELRETNVRLAEESRERQKAARAIGKSAVLLRATLESTGDGILVVGAEGKIESYNNQFRQMWGLPEEMLAAGDEERTLNHVLQLLRTPATFLAKVQSVYTHTEAASFDVLELKDGRIFERYSQPQVIEGKLAGRVWSFRDVTGRQRAADALRRSEQQLRNIVETSQDLIWSVDAEGRWSFVNAAAKRIYGYEPAELLGHHFNELLSPEQAQKDLAIFERIKTGESFFQYETEHHRKDGTPVILSFNAIVLRNAEGLVLGATGTAADITKRKQMETEQQNMNRKLLETQKLESLGVLAGGIAHDFNNLLTGILGNASLARMELPEQSPLHAFLEQIEIASLRAADLCKQMLAYSGKARFQVQRVNLNALVEETMHLLRVSISRKTAFHSRLAPELPPIAADATQIHQVIMNLVLNAAEAIGEQAGDITLRTGMLRVDRGYLRQTYLAPDLPEGEYVFLEVGDSGCGMTAETQAKIFDPFFTTKFTGRGLGLAAVLGIVRGHRGALKVNSEPGRGTTFKLLLPRGDEAVGGSRDPGAATPIWRGAGTVLVVDDEAALREVAARVLESFGFQVVLAVDGSDGVAKFRERPGDFVAVLTDLTMPEMDGEEAFREIRKIRADTRVLLMSGFSEQDAINRFTGKGLAGFIQKPFKIAALRDKMREILG